jgi:hypothetical protein
LRLFIELQVALFASCFQLGMLVNEIPWHDKRVHRLRVADNKQARKCECTKNSFHNSPAKKKDRKLNKSIERTLMNAYKC